MNKKMSILLSGALIAGLLAGCGAKDSKTTASPSPTLQQPNKASVPIKIKNGQTVHIMPPMTNLMKNPAGKRQ
ncbi:hypothetical protein P7H06_03995 [Paenibacillus larvae]|nr:hypothetical protein [Paenibacillus larvae]MDT2258893.1 hypothetical protein [Paenibacillus larvae]